MVLVRWNPVDQNILQRDWLLHRTANPRGQKPPSTIAIIKGPSIFYSLKIIS